MNLNLLYIKSTYLKCQWLSSHNAFMNTTREEAQIDIDIHGMRLAAYHGDYWRLTTTLTLIEYSKSIKIMRCMHQSKER